MSEKSKETIAEKKVSRRSMLKWTGALAAAAVVGAVAEYGASELTKPPPPPPVSFKPPLSPEVKDRVDAIVKQLIDMHADEQVQYTDCDANGCRGGPCSVRVRVKNGVVTAIENGDPTNQKMPVEDVYAGEDALKKYTVQARPCTRAYMWPKTINHPDRVKYPMKSVGNRGERKFVRISWQEALDTIFSKMSALKEKYGPYFLISPPSVGQYANFGYSYWGYTSGSSHFLADIVMFGEIAFGKYQAGSSTNVLDFFNTKAVVGFGFNPMINRYGGGSSEWTYFLKYLQEKGLPVILVDPVYSLTAETLGAQWVPIRAGTDLAMLLAMANVLFKENLYDKAYVDKYVEPTGFAKWKDYVLGNTAGEDGAIDRTPEWAEKICGVPADTIRELTRFCAKNRPIHFTAYWSIAKKVQGEMCGWASECVKVMLGAVGVPGGCDSQVRGGAVKYLTFPRADWKQAKATWDTARQLNYMRTKTVSADLYPQLVKGQITEDRYRREIGCAADWPLPRPVMFWFGSTQGDMDTSRRLRANKNAEFIVSVAYHSTYPDSFNADIVLPLADAHFEDYRGIMSGVNSFIIARKSVDPPGEAKSATWIDAQLAKRFGVLDKEYPLLKDVLDDPKAFDQVYETVLKEAYETYAAKDDIKPFNPPSWDEFIKQPVFRVPYVGYSYNQQDKPPFHAYDAFLADPSKAPLDTPSGKMEFYSTILTDPDLATKEYIKPQSKIKSEICFGGASPPVIPPMPQWTNAWDDPLTKFGEKYPLETISLHSNYLQHHSQDNNPYRRELGRHACWLSVADAKARGIKDGDLVRVYTDVGECIMPAHVTSRMIPGTANVGYGAWYEPSAVKTELMPDGVDRRGQQNFLTPSGYYPWTAGCASVMHNCQVEKFDA
jgi:anaerobic dimethyl sulfoxide reductase subunit A